MDHPLEHTIDESKKITLRRIKAASLFTLVATGVFSLFVPLIIFFGILAIFGFRTIHVNLQPVVGLPGFMASLVMAPLVSLFLSIFIWIVLYLGIRIWGIFAPHTITYVPDR